MWLFRHKYLADGTLSRFKARLVANGSTHLEGIDVDETFSLVVKSDTIWTVLSLATSQHWPPLEFQDSAHPDYVCLLWRSLYGLKQALRAWFQRFAAYITCVRIILSQRKYAIDIFEREHMVNCNPSRTPVDTESKLGDDGDLVCLYMHDLWEPHFSAHNWILRYVRGTLDYGLLLFSSSTISLVAYSDTDWAGCLTTRRSTFGYCVFLDNNLLSWSSKRQLMLSRSSAKVEYHGVANAIAETCWLGNLLRELHTRLSFATLVYCDSVSAVYLSSNPVHHQRVLTPVRGESLKILNGFDVSLPVSHSLWSSQSFGHQKGVCPWLTKNHFNSQYLLETLVIEYHMVCGKPVQAIKD
ncbi:ribonuclease H-like domain-containing protein [Tanacetum coccineum]